MIARASTPPTLARQLLSLSLLALSLTAFLSAGTLSKYQLTDSRVFPGTTRDYWIYLPTGHDAEKPACLMVFQDGERTLNPKGADRIPERFEQLIAAGEMPMTVALFINPGVTPTATGEGRPRSNRSFEYDSLTNRYATFLIDEMLPRLAQEHKILISDDPNDRAIAGASSGAACAFTVAWQRPDAFRRVLSGIGTYVDIRGAGDYPTLIRKTAPKPLRVFLEDGRNDLNNAFGHWFLANQSMLQALQYAGYEVEHRWGEGGHNREHLGRIMPEALRWLWKDHATQPVRTHPERSQSPASHLLAKSEGWELVASGFRFAEGMKAAPDGTLFFTDVFAEELYKISPDGSQSLLASGTGRANGLALTHDGSTLYTASSGAKEIRSYDIAKDEWQVVASGHTSNDLVVTRSGHLYYTDPKTNKVRHLNLKSGVHGVADERSNRPNGIGLSPDENYLYVADFGGDEIFSYTIQPDGTLANKQPFFKAILPPDRTEGRLDGMASTADGRLFAATEAGVQVFTPKGASQILIPRPKPTDNRTNYLTFGGVEKDLLYVAVGDSIYRRKLQLSKQD